MRQSPVSYSCKHPQKRIDQEYEDYQEEKPAEGHVISHHLPQAVAMKPPVAFRKIMHTRAAGIVQRYLKRIGSHC